MPGFLALIPPSEARDLLFSKLPAASLGSEVVSTEQALGRVCGEDIFAPHELPNFKRSSVDGFAVRARDTFGSNDTMPAYLKLIGEVLMGTQPTLAVESGMAASIHTGGMLPAGADSVVMLEYTQVSRQSEIEISKSVAVGENVIQVGEDVKKGQLICQRGKIIRPAEIGGLFALGVLELRVVNRISVGIISSGDEIVHPSTELKIGQIRDINSSTLSALVKSYGGDAKIYGIAPDRLDALAEIAETALNECDVVLITAGSSASTRDITADVINNLGAPGVLVHGINTRPGKPTILGICRGKAVIGLPGNPVSALVNGLLFVVPLIKRFTLQPEVSPQPTVKAILTINIPSQAGREDWQPVKLVCSESGWMAEPVFGKSNLIFSLSAADGLLCVPADSTGFGAGDFVEVHLF